MQQRRLPFLPEFNCKILHLSGSENVVADALPRPNSGHDLQPLSVSDPIRPDSENNFQPNSIPAMSTLSPPPVPRISFTEMARL